MILKLFFVSFTAILFWGCSPVYKVVYNYEPPKNSSGKFCTKSCYKDLRVCKQNCQKKEISCNKKAEALAQKEYEKELSDYKYEQSEYERKYDLYLQRLKTKDELKERLEYYTDICNSKKDRYACEKMYSLKNDYRRYDYISRPIEPTRPSLSSIVHRLKREMCNTSCGCEELFRNCYRSCGGKVISKKVCIAHCPND